VLAWQAGGAIGDARLSAVGASPWQFGLAIAGALLVAAEAALAALAALDWWRTRDVRDTADALATTAVIRPAPPVETPERAEEPTTRAG
jgi:hypothetical protein